MAYAITQTCCTDAACVAVCPVNCIHPTPEEKEFGSTEMLHIDPRACIDCGACADACPVDAVLPVDSLRGGQRAYAALNADHFADPPPEPEDGSPNFHAWGGPSFARVLPADFPPLRVAVVGTGPAGMYAVEDLVLHTGAEVTLVDRLPEPGGLARYGVAPDHPATRRVGARFARFHEHPRVRLHLGLDIGGGTGVGHDELAAHHDAVVYAVGASGDRRIGIPGEDLPGSLSATAFVGWYNGRPDAPQETVDLSSARVVVVGNGNVALDMARILLSDPESLAGTDIAPRALEELRRSAVREVVVLGRRGPEDAACTRPEMLALKHLPGVDLVVDDHDARIGRSIDASDPPGRAGMFRGVARETIDWTVPPAAGRRIVLRFRSAPTALLGEGRVAAVRTTDGTGGRDIPAGTVLRAVGHRGRPVPGLPFDERTGTVPHDAGRVTGRPGTYVVGWIKRGPSGGIGANRGCAAETVGSLLADAVAGNLPAPTGTPRSFARLARRRRRGRN
ncbi:FAD-dependent oxidoreductase [Streptomyces sp. TR06-5]|uniref:FAD-dependent oxidoreductase n=1 Tax=unclassified Streptomyces TaxID=2593676 RepID=UPI0039A19714